MKIDDKMIGRAIKLARLHRSKSQQWLGEQPGVDCTYQQIQKYEAGSNRVTLGVFVAICSALDVKVGDDVAAWIKKTAAL